MTATETKPKTAEEKAASGIVTLRLKEVPGLFEAAAKAAGDTTLTSWARKIIADSVGVELPAAETIKVNKAEQNQLLSLMLKQLDPALVAQLTEQAKTLAAAAAAAKPAKKADAPAPAATPDAPAPATK